MSKERKKDKKGCLKNSLIAGLILLVVVLVVVMLVLNLLNQKSTTDARLTELLNQQYTSFQDYIGDEQTTTMRQKIGSAVVMRDGSSVIVNNAIDFDKLFSTVSYFRDELHLTGYDIGAILNELFGSLSVEQYIEVIDLQLDMVSTERLAYSVIFKVNLSALANIFPFAVSDLPDEIFVTLNATYNTLAPSSSAIESANLRINRLSGDDNTYAVQQLSSYFEITNDDVYAVAAYPFDLIREYLSSWNAIFNISNNMFNFIPK